MANAIWLALKDKLGGTYATKRRKLTIKLKILKKCGNVSMHQHLREMNNMTQDLGLASHILSDKQKVQVVIHSLSDS